jgi:hypothetical protein
VEQEIYGNNLNVFQPDRRALRSLNQVHWRGQFRSALTLSYGIPHLYQAIDFQQL